MVGEREWERCPVDNEKKKATWWKSNPGNWKSAIFNKNIKSVWDGGMKGWNRTGEAMQLHLNAILLP